MKVNNKTLLQTLYRGGCSAGPRNQFIEVARNMGRLYKLFPEIINLAQKFKF